MCRKPPSSGVPQRYKHQVQFELLYRARPEDARNHGWRIPWIKARGGAHGREKQGQSWLRIKIAPGGKSLACDQGVLHFLLAMDFPVGCLPSSTSSRPLLHPLLLAAVLAPGLPLPSQRLVLLLLALLVKSARCQTATVRQARCCQVVRRCFRQPTTHRGLGAVRSGE